MILFARPWLAGWLLFVGLVLVSWGCGSQEEDATGQMTPAPQPASAPAQATSAVSSFYGGDTARLRAEGASDEVLVHSGQDAFITVEEYNAWLGSYPMNITAEEYGEAQKQALEQMVTYKLLVEKARESGVGRRAEAQGYVLDDSDLAVHYIRSWVTDTASITDAEALAYEERESELFAEIAKSDIPYEIKMIGLKGSIRGEQLWEQMKIWMQEAEIRYHYDV